MIDPLAGNLSIVVFLTDAGDTAHLKALVEAPLPGISRRLGEATHRLEHRGQELLPLLQRSAQRVYPNARFVILTDATTVVPPLRPPAAVIRRPLDGQPLMYERMISYIEYLDAAQDDGCHVLIDSDVLMTARFATPLETPFDLAFTYKVKNGRWGINAGVIVVAPGGRVRALAFLRRTLAIYGACYVEDPHWGSDQLALREAVGLPVPPVGPIVVDTPDARVLLLLCDQHNYSPDGRWSDLLDKPNGRFVWHFKGRLKKFMPWYFRLHLDDASAVGQLVAHAFVAVQAGAERLRSRAGRVLRAH